VEVEAPLADHTERASFPNFMYPILLHPSAGPTLYNMPYLNLIKFPTLDTVNSAAFDWPNIHVPMQMSEHEWKMRERSMKDHSYDHKDVRTAFKDSIASLFITTAGLGVKRSFAFGLNNEKAGGVNVVILVSAMKLDMANHTVVLDAAIWLLTHAQIGLIGDFIDAIGSETTRAVNVDDEELKLWKEILPAFVERCQDWEHKLSCEYRKRKAVPLSIESGQELFCSCGSGTFPKGFMPGISRWLQFPK